MQILPTILPKFPKCSAISIQVQILALRQFSFNVRDTNWINNENLSQSCRVLRWKFTDRVFTASHVQLALNWTDFIASMEYIIGFMFMFSWMCLHFGTRKFAIEFGTHSWVYKILQKYESRDSKSKSFLFSVFQPVCRDSVLRDFQVDCENWKLFKIARIFILQGLLWTKTLEISKFIVNFLKFRQKKGWETLFYVMR